VDKAVDSLLTLKSDPTSLVASRRQKKEEEEQQIRVLEMESSFYKPYAQKKSGWPVPGRNGREEKEGERSGKVGTRKTRGVC